MSLTDTSSVRSPAKLPQLANELADVSYQGKKNKKKNHNVDNTIEGPNRRCIQSPEVNIMSIFT